MPQQYDDTNRGAMFPNQYKQEGSKQPDFRGVLNVDGKEYDLSCWVKMSKKGKEFYSISVKPKPASDDQDIPINWGNNNSR